MIAKLEVKLEAKLESDVSLFRLIREWYNVYN